MTTLKKRLNSNAEKTELKTIVRMNQRLLKIEEQLERENRRLLTAKVRDKILSDEPLSLAEGVAVWQVLDCLLQGLDARIELGISPPRGAPRDQKGFHNVVAWDYWIRRNGKPAILEKKVASDVAERWELSMSQVRSIAKAGKESYAVFGADEQEALLEVIEESHRGMKRKTLFPVK